MKRNLFLKSLVGLFIFAVIGCSNAGGGGRSSPPPPTKHSKPGLGNVVAFGDSLTSSILPNRPYTDFMPLANIQNTAIPGINSEQALSLFENRVLALNPKLVIITIGGNDALQEPRLTPVQSNQNLAKMIALAHDKGALVLFAGIQPPVKQLYPSVANVPDEYIERAYGISRFGTMAEAARMAGALVIPDLLEGVWLNNALKADVLHPNTEGNKVLAKKIMSVLEGHYP